MDINEPYLFTVIMALYNQEKYLDVAIRSVLNQSIGFQDSIQIILVNDGSTDSTKQICDTYREKYPDNIKIINKENGGVSSARNAGIPFAEGNYVLFFDGDDYWPENAFSRIYQFFEMHKDEVDICSTRIINFDENNNEEYHILDFKYKNGSRTADLTEEPELVQSTVGNVIFKNSIIKGISFNEDLITGEDSTLINELLLDRLKVGLIADVTFYYRRSSNELSVSKKAPNTKEWYLDVPRQFYLHLIECSIEKYGKTIPYIQHVIMYDIQWRKYNPLMMQVINEKEKRDHLRLMHLVLEQIDDSVIVYQKNITQYFRFYLFDIKYGRQIINEAELKKTKIYYNGIPVFNLRKNSVLQINYLEIIDDKVIIEGYSRLDMIKRQYSVYAEDEKGVKYEIREYEKERGGAIGYFDEKVYLFKSFRVEIPVRNQLKLRFAAVIEGKKLVLYPGFDYNIRLKRKYNNSYDIKNGFIVKYLDKRLCFYRDSFKTRLASERRYRKEIEIKSGKDALLERKKEYRLITSTLYSNKTKKQAAFVSVRKDDALTDNLKCVYEAFDGKKVMHSKMLLRKNPDKLYEAAEIMAESKVVITDDYYPPMFEFEKKKGQCFIQLWHAAGAFKKFGVDGTELSPSFDSHYHRNYDIVCVSSEYVRKIYADAFGLPIDKIKALGVPRTDKLHDEAHIQKEKENLLNKYNELQGKQILLYSPTFRDLPGVPRAEFKPQLDFDALSDSLRDDQCFVICPHPVMTTPILKKKYDNIIEIRDLSTEQVMCSADILITDYSSVIFDYSFFMKPIAFFCYDFDSYNRDFYLDYERDLPGVLLKSSDELISYLKKGEYHVSEKMQEFRERYMGACDGHSTGRIVKVIHDMLNKN